MSLRVLIVDDHPQVRRGAGRLLRTVNDAIEVTFASNSDQAIEFVAEAPFDLIISDVHMGKGMDGISLYHHMAETYPDQSKRMIFFTASFDDERFINRLMQLPVTVVPKPMHKSLVQAVLDHFGKRD